MNTLNEIAVAVHAVARSKGFHEEQDIRTFMANACNNMHAEVTELWDAWRAGEEEALCDKAGKMMKLDLPLLTKTQEELADLIIRALDVSQRLDIDIVRAVLAKHEYNKTRPHKHGKLN